MRPTHGYYQLRMLVVRGDWNNLLLFQARVSAFFVFSAVWWKESDLFLWHYANGILFMDTIMKLTLARVAIQTNYSKLWVGPSLLSLSMSYYGRIYQILVKQWEFGCFSLSHFLSSPALGRTRTLIKHRSITVHFPQLEAHPHPHLSVVRTFCGRKE